MKFLFLLSLFLFLAAPSFASDGDTKKLASANAFVVEQDNDDNDAVEALLLSKSTDLQKQEMQLWKKPEYAQMRSALIAEGFPEYAKRSETDEEQRKRLASFVKRFPQALEIRIFEFAHGDANYRINKKKKLYIAQNMKKLIPAILSWENRNQTSIFRSILEARKFCVKKNRGPATMMMTSRSRHWHESEIRPPSDFGLIRNELNLFIAYAFPDGVVFKVCPRKFKLLEESPQKHLEFFVELYDQREAQVASFKQLTGDDDLEIIDLVECIVFTPEQYAFFRDELVSNPAIIESGIPRNIAVNYKCEHPKGQDLFMLLGEHE